MPRLNNNCTPIITECCEWLVARLCGHISPSSTHNYHYSNIVIGKEPSHYHCCTVVTAVCTMSCETQTHHNSPHFLIQYSKNIGKFKVSSTCTYRSHGDTTRNTPGSLGVGFAMKYCYTMLNAKAVCSLLAWIRGPAHVKELNGSLYAWNQQ